MPRRSVHHFRAIIYCYDHIRIHYYDYLCNRIAYARRMILPNWDPEGFAQVTTTTQENCYASHTQIDHRDRHDRVGRIRRHGLCADDRYEREGAYVHVCRPVGGPACTLG